MPEIMTKTNWAVRPQAQDGTDPPRWSGLSALTSRMRPSHAANDTGGPELTALTRCDALPSRFVRPGLLLDRLAGEAEELEITASRHGGLRNGRARHVVRLANDVNRVCVTVTELVFQLAVAASAGVLFAFVIHEISF